MMVEENEVERLKEELYGLRRDRNEWERQLFAADFISTHKITGERDLRLLEGKDPPLILVAILAKQKEKSLPFYLECLERLDYPKSSIVLYVRTNNNKDKTKEILEAWLRKAGHRYRAVDFDASDVDAPVQEFKVHEWNAVRFKVLAEIRNVSLTKTLQHKCQYYFVCDVDNFVVPSTLKNLVALSLPIVSPLLRNFAEGSFNSNFFLEVDANGYYQEAFMYLPVLSRVVKGILEVKLVHHTYLIRHDVISELTYEDGTGRYEFVVFSDSARRANVQQYIDTRQIYGYITSGDEFGYTPGDEEEARRNGLTEQPGQVELTRAIFERMWSENKLS